jgi:hypothetical protein
VSSSVITGPYFEDDVELAVTVSSDQYKVMLEDFLVNELHHHD